jgi:hypothetical protein
MGQFLGKCGLYRWVVGCDKVFLGELVHERGFPLEDWSATNFLGEFMVLTDGPRAKDRDFAPLDCFWR